MHRLRAHQIPSLYHVVLDPKDKGQVPPLCEMGLREDKDCFFLDICRGPTGSEHSKGTRPWKVKQQEIALHESTGP